MPARYLHPEFGYLCPTPRLRGFLRGALFAGALGILGGVVALRVGHEPAVSALSVISAGVSQSDTKLTPSAGAVKAAENAGGSQAGLVRNEHLTFHVRPPVASADSARPEPGQVSSAKPACEDNTWAYLDGKCSAIKPRWVRVRVPAETPKAAAPAASPGKAKAASSGHAEEAGKRASSSNSRQPAETSRAAASKKTQTAARNQGRRWREASEKYAGRDERSGFFNSYAAYAPEYGRGGAYPTREGAAGWGRAW